MTPADTYCDHVGGLMAIAVYGCHDGRPAADTYRAALVELVLTYPTPEDSEKLVAGVRAAKARTYPDDGATGHTVTMERDMRGHWAACSCGWKSHVSPYLDNVDDIAWGHARTGK